jgi:hypothetical protein
MTAIEAQQDRFDDRIGHDNLLSSPSLPPSTPTVPVRFSSKRTNFVLQRDKKTQSFCWSFCHGTDQTYFLGKREGRNCLGKRSKVALDPVKLGLVKKLIFLYYPAGKEYNKESTCKAMYHMQ